jgi:hypothetical protein
MHVGESPTSACSAWTLLIDELVTIYWLAEEKNLKDLETTSFVNFLFYYRGYGHSPYTSYQ